MKHIIRTGQAPAAIGPYSQGIRAGSFIFVSGQLPIDPQTKAFAADDVQGQTAQSIQNIRAILQADGATLADVVKTTVYLQDMGEFAAMNEVYATYFTGDCPARAAVEVAKLPMGARVEIEAIAFKKD